jgi:hypothetical protein
MKSKRNPVARELRTPRFRKRVVERKDKTLPRKHKHKQKDQDE